MIAEINKKNRRGRPVLADKKILTTIRVDYYDMLELQQIIINNPKIKLSHLFDAAIREYLQINRNKYEIVENI